MPTTSQKHLIWYLRSLGDHDTHCGSLHKDGTVSALCGARFAPQPTMRVVGPPLGELATGPLALPGNPPDPEQVCPECKRGRSDQ